MKKTRPDPTWKGKEKKKKKPPNVKGKRKKKEDEETKLTEPSKERKKKGSKVVVDFDCGTQYVVLITEMQFKTELWKLKTTKMCFQFP